MKRLPNVLTLGCLVLLVVIAINLAGQSFGFWGTHTRTVTVICSYDAHGKPRCMSEPIKVRTGR
jgi:hypothetical protein